MRAGTFWTNAAQIYSVSVGTSTPLGLLASGNAQRTESHAADREMSIPPLPGAVARAIRERPEVLATFRLHYRGLNDPLDALNWLDDPDAPATSGEQSPASAVRSLRNAVYGPAPRPDAVEELERAVALLQTERAETCRALEAAFRVLPEGSRPIPDEDATEPGGAGATGAARPRSRARRDIRVLIPAILVPTAAVIVACLWGATGVPTAAATHPAAAVQIVDDPRAFDTNSLDARLPPVPPALGRLVDRARGTGAGGRSRAVPVAGDALVVNIACSGVGTARLDLDLDGRTSALFSCPRSPGVNDGVLLPVSGPTLHYRVAVSTGVTWALSIGQLTASETARLPAHNESGS